MATDKNGRELKVGDEVWVRATVISLQSQYGGEIVIRLVPWGDDNPVDGHDVLLQPVPPDEFLPPADNAVLSSAEIEAMFGPPRKI